MKAMKHILMLSLVVWVLALLDTPQAAAQITYTTKMTSGPFLLAPTALSVDWQVVNNDTETVDICVTVYELHLMEPKTEVPPGIRCFSLDPGYTRHNANSVGSVFFLGSVYEVVVEATSDKVHPNVNQWSGHTASDFIPGTLIPAGDFVTIKTPKPPKP